MPSWRATLPVRADLGNLCVPKPHLNVTTPHSEERGFAVLTGRPTPYPSPQAPSEPRKTLTPRFAAKKAPPYWQASAMLPAPPRRGGRHGCSFGVLPIGLPDGTPTPSFKVHGERCPQGEFTTYPPLTMLCAPSEHVGESMYPRSEEAGDYSSPTPPLFSKPRGSFAIRGSNKQVQAKADDR